MQWSKGISCHFYDEVYGSAAGLRNAMRAHRINANAKDSFLACHIHGGLARNHMQGCVLLERCGSHYKYIYDYLNPTLLGGVPMV